MSPFIYCDGIIQFSCFHGDFYSEGMKKVNRQAYFANRIRYKVSKHDERKGKTRARRESDDGKRQDTHWQPKDASLRAKESTG